MCGILAVIGIESKEIECIEKKAIASANLLIHRGPDFLGVTMTKNKSCILCHQRLAIVDLISGNQPLVSQDGQIRLICNGEIYNHLQLRESIKIADEKWTTKSDCESLLHLFSGVQSSLEIAEKIRMIDGIFAFVLVDDKTDHFLIARDHIGIIPLYYGFDLAGNLWVASELKALQGMCVSFKEFPAGHFIHGKIGEHDDKRPARWYQPPFYSSSFESMTWATTDTEKLESLFKQAVKKQMMCDVPFGILLSGGVDSSIVAACASEFSKQRTEDPTGKSGAWWPQIHTFSIGLKESPDLKNAAIVAKHLKTVHHEFVMTVEEGLANLSNVIYHLETYDVTTVRASTPMYLMAEKIKTFGIKMILSGEGSDEMLGGYLYFHKCPSPEEFFCETVRKLKLLHKYDCLRANKAMAAFGVETRVPFLDKDFLEYVMTLHPKDKMCGKASPDGKRIEKWILRKAFEKYLPQEIIWRQKAQFSDAVSGSVCWIDSLKQFASQQISDVQMAKVAEIFPKNPPSTKEAFLYRMIFERHFPGKSAEKCVNISGASVACSTSIAAQWDASWAGKEDPSGATVRDVCEI
jgi:asparagine synthase (glutamine-hydrolysing)